MLVDWLLDTGKYKKVHGSHLAVTNYVYGFKKKADFNFFYLFTRPEIH